MIKNINRQLAVLLLLVFAVGVALMLWVAQRRVGVS